MGHADLWCLEKGVTYLNHGSFGACPRAVLAEQSRLRDRMEAQPVRFFMRELPDLLAGARSTLAAFVGSEPEDLVFVRNATAAVNAVLRSIELGPGDEVLTTDHVYPACRNAMDDAVARTGARVVVARVPFPLSSEDDVVAPVLEATSPRTRLAILDHVTSPTALVLPVARLVRELDGRGIDTLVDGAHAPGMLPLDLEALGAAYYTGNAHKWLCAPKGAALLRVRRDRRAAVRPLSISHGATAALEGRPRLHVEFDWTGTDDPTPALCIPAALQLLEGLFPGGIAELRARNHALALRGRDLVCRALSIPPPAPDTMLGAMAAVPIPPSRGAPPSSPFGTEGSQARLVERFGIEVPIFGWPAWPRRLLRISAQAYNQEDDYVRLATALTSLAGDL